MPVKGLRKYEAKAMIKAEARERVRKAEYRGLTQKELPEIVKRYLAGEMVEVLAKEAGRPERVIYEWMLTGVGEENYRDLVTKALVARIADADTKLEEAANIMEVSKYREKARFARMDFERRRPVLYGAKQELASVTLAPIFHVTVNEVAREPRVIEGEVRAIEEQKAG